MRSTWGGWCSLICVACVASLAACDSPKTGAVDSGVAAEWDFGDDPLAIRLNVEDGSAVFACGAGFTQAQVDADLARAITSAPQRCQGSEGGYQCECERTLRESYAFSCPAALFETCQVFAEPVDGSGDEAPVVSACHALSREIEGSCTLEGDDFECVCEDQAPVVTPAGDAPTPASCDQALFGACAPPCADDFGTCMPSPRGTLGEYDCTCDTNGFTHVARGASCADALLWACNPLNQVEEVCTGYGGACVVVDSERPELLRCSCVDGTAQDVEHVPASVEPRFRACRETLEATCGLGSPPEGAQCVAEANGYHARCTRGPSEDATMICECYAAGEEPDDRVEPIDERSCDMATLEAFCPELID